MIRDRHGVEVRFPIIRGSTLAIPRGLGIVSAQDSDSAAVRTTFFIDPRGMIRATTCYAANPGHSVAEMLRILDGLQAIDERGALAPANWQPGEPLFESPRIDLDAVFDAEGAAAWFLRPVGSTAP